MTDSKSVGQPASPIAKQGQNIPPGARVERRESSRINSPTSSGGEVPTDFYKRGDK
jgi:hypothetical protein